MNCPELGLVLVADGLMERDWRLRGALDRGDLLGLDAGQLGDLLDRRLAADPGHELALRPSDLVELLDDVDRDPDRPGLVRERTGDRLPDPPRTSPIVPSWIRSSNGSPLRKGET
jgi:hypothetical protein